MTSKVIREWLSEYKSLSDAELHSYSCTVRQNEDLTDCLYKLFEDKPQSELSIDYLELVLDPVCHQLFEFYRSKETELRRFTLEFIPSLIWMYLSFLSANDKRSCGGVEALLLGIYNLEIVHTDGKVKVKSFRVPNIAQSSVYHEPESISSVGLTERALSQYNKTDIDVWRSGPFPQYEAINSQNRHGILAIILQCYNSDITSLSPKSRRNLCKTASRLATSGLSELHHLQEHDSPALSEKFQPEKHESENRDVSPRQNISPAILIEFLSGIYFVMFNGEPTLGTQAVEDIHYRACYELYADVLLVTSAIRNSLKYNVSGQPLDGPMGMCVALSPAAVSSVSKTALTNASFKIKKLPDDIPVPKEEEGNSKLLPTIEEDGYETPVAKTHSKTGVKMGMKIMKKVEKAMGKDSSPRSVANGDTVDSFSVSVIKGQNKHIVDSIEMQGVTKRLSQNNSLEDHDGSFDDDSSSISSREKKMIHPSPVPSHSSVNSNSYSTDL